MFFLWSVLVRGSALRCDGGSYNQARYKRIQTVLSLYVSAAAYFFEYLDAANSPAALSAMLSSETLCVRPARTCGESSVFGKSSG